ncbi:putative methyltransferase-domain-containing protein [Mycena amicta]|nr:putative methyltransferase-domain-containing protein [Mycena amicta]
MIRLLPNSEQVLDADEEVFILYSRATNSSNRGLGYVDNRQDILTLSFELKSGSTPPMSKAKRRQHNTQEKTVEIQMMQDKTALRSRAGDTGSIVWRASIDFAQLILQQHYAKSPEALFDLERLSSSRILELGSGTGLLSIALSPLVAHYTATDIQELQLLMTKNLRLNFPRWPANPSAGYNVALRELDWQTLDSLPPARRTQYFPLTETPFDIVLVVDCIYHPSLLPALLTSIDYATTTGTTVVVVVMELRADDVTREFLERWLALGDGEWEIWRVSNEMEEGILARDTPYVVWVGWKGSRPSEAASKCV